jgi:quinol monooxygenase YgiN
LLSSNWSSNPASSGLVGINGSTQATRQATLTSLDEFPPNCFQSAYLKGENMALYETGAYQIKPSAIDKVKLAIREFVEYLETNEPGTEMYLAWQQKEDPTRFLHLFRFRDAAASNLHGQSQAVKKFESAYRPELAGGDLVFTEYEMVAGKLAMPSQGGQQAFDASRASGKDIKSDVGDILQNFYTAAINRDFPTMRGYLRDDLVFEGLFETYRSADQYLKLSKAF